VVGDIKAALEGIADLASPQTESRAQTLRQTIVEELNAHAQDDSLENSNIKKPLLSDS
jgi:hypothetical protein